MDKKKKSAHLENEIQRQKCIYNDVKTGKYAKISITEWERHSGKKRIEVVQKCKKDFVEPPKYTNYNSSYENERCEQKPESAVMFDQIIFDSF